MNQEIYNNFKSPDIVTVITVGRVKWLGNVVRADGTRTVKNTFFIITNRCTIIPLTPTCFG
jgi:hypothetical protein